MAPGPSRPGAFLCFDGRSFSPRASRNRSPCLQPRSCLQVLGNNFDALTARRAARSPVCRVSPGIGQHTLCKTTFFSPAHKIFAPKQEEKLGIRHAGEHRPARNPKPRKSWQAAKSRWPRKTTKVRGGPVSRVLSWAAIYLLRTSPSASSAQPERSAGHTMALLFAFAPDGACQAAVLPRRWWSLTPPFQLFPLRSPRAAPVGVFFSAALSVGLPRPAVSRHPALWSPDFPHDAQARPAVAWPTSRGYSTTNELLARGLRLFYNT